MEEKIRAIKLSIDNKSLLVSAATNNIEDVKCLISEGANVNFVDTDGETPLHFAALGGALEVVQLLLGKNAAIVVNNENETAIDIVKRLDRQDILQLFEKIRIPCRYSSVREKPRSQDGSRQKYSVKEQAAEPGVSHVPIGLDSVGEHAPEPAASYVQTRHYYVEEQAASHVPTGQDSVSEQASKPTASHIPTGQDFVIEQTSKPAAFHVPTGQDSVSEQTSKPTASHIPTGQDFVIEQTSKPAAFHVPTGQDSVIEQASKPTASHVPTGQDFAGEGATNKDQSTYSKRTGTSNIAGQFYEINSIILGRLRGPKNTGQFYLASNMNGTGAFDDIVVRYRNNDENKETSKLFFIQLKHLDDPKKGKISIEKFINPLNSDRNFYLGKYLSGYLEIQKTMAVENNSLLFCEPKDCKYIIYTNAILDESFDRNRIVNAEPNIFYTESKSKNYLAFKFKFSGENNDLINNLQNREKINSLAKNLVSFIWDPKFRYSNMLLSESFKTFHVFISKKVIVIDENEKMEINGTKYREGRLSKQFLEIDNSDLLMEFLREEVFYEYAKMAIFSKQTRSYVIDSNTHNTLVDKMHNSLQTSGELDFDTIKKLAGKAIVIDDASRKLKFVNPEKLVDNNIKQLLNEVKDKVGDILSYRFNFPSELIKEELQKHTEKTLKVPVTFGNINPAFKEIEHFVKQLITLLETYKTETVITIDDSIAGSGKLLNDENVKNIGKLIGNLLVFDHENKKIMFSKEEHFYENVMELLNMLKLEASSNGLELDNIKFDIKIKNFPRDTLYIDDENTIRDFLNKLEIFTGQAGNDELEEIIKNELKDSYGLTEYEAEQSWLNILHQTKKYWQKTGSVEYLQNNDFIEKIVRLGIKFDLKGPVESFTGRERELDYLSQMIQANSNKITAISGLGGVGKTQLVRKYISEHSNEYDNNIIWIKYEKLEDSFHRLSSNKLDISTKDNDGIEFDTMSIMENAYRFFSNRKSLLIFDNVDDDVNSNKFSLFLAALSCCESIPDILITTRIQEWESVVKVFKLKSLEKDEAKKLVKNGLKISEEDGKKQDAEIKRLVAKLQYFPLAIQQAVDYIKWQSVEGEFNIKSFLTKYEKIKDNLLNYKLFQGISFDYKETTYTTWRMTIEQIRIEQNGELALKILNIMAFFAPENIQRELFLKFSNNNEEILRSAVRLLVKYSMVNEENRQSILNIHRLVQEVTRLNLEKQDSNVSIGALGHAILLFENNINSKNVDHAMSVWSYVKVKQHDGLVKEFIPLLPNIVEQLKESFRYDEVILFGNQALRLIKRTIPQNCNEIKEIEKSIAAVQKLKALSSYSYEINTLILARLRGQKNTGNFYLAFNVNAAHAFDDIVIRYWINDENKEKSKLLFIQTLHKFYLKRNKITVKKLITPKNNSFFYLGRYLLGYLDIQETMAVESKNILFHEPKDCKYIIYTNAILDEGFDRNRIVEADNNIYYTESKSKKDLAFKFKLSSENNDLINTLKGTLHNKNIKILAKDLVTCICDRKVTMRAFESFEIFHVFLSKNVIEIDKDEKIENKKTKYREARLKMSFLEMNSDDSLIKLLREEVFFEYAKRKYFKKQKYSALKNVNIDPLVDKMCNSLQFSREIDSDTIEELAGTAIILDARSRKLKFFIPKIFEDNEIKELYVKLKYRIGDVSTYRFPFPSELIKKDLANHAEKIIKLNTSFGNINPTFNELKHFVKQLLKLVEQFKTEDVVKIDDRIVGQGKILTYEDMKNIEKLVGNLLVFDHESRMLIFSKEEIFDENVMELLNMLKMEANLKGLELDDIKFDIKVKDFPIDTLYIDDEKVIRDFLSKLEIFTGQAGNEELEEIIKNELKESYGLTEYEAKQSFLNIQNKTKIFWGETGSLENLQNKDDFFEKIVRS